MPGVPAARAPAPWADLRVVGGAGTQAITHHLTVARPARAKVLPHSGNSTDVVGSADSYAPPVPATARTSHCIKTTPIHNRFGVTTCVGEGALPGESTSLSRPLQKGRCAIHCWSRAGTPRGPDRDKTVVVRGLPPGRPLAYHDPSNRVSACRAQAPTGVCSGQDWSCAASPREDRYIVRGLPPGRQRAYRSPLKKDVAR